MTFRRFFAILALCFVVAPVVYAAQEKVLRTTLTNGLRVVIVPNKAAPVVTTEVNYLAGKNDDPADLPGVAQSVQRALLNMASPSSKKLKKNRYSVAAAASMGLTDGTILDPSVSRYFYTVPKQELVAVLHIEARRMSGFDLKPSVWDKVKQSYRPAEKDLKILKSFFKKLQPYYGALFKGTPYANQYAFMPLSSDRITISDLKQFYDTWYVPNNAVMVIVGDVEPQAVLAQVKLLFGAIPRKALPSRPALFHFQPVQRHVLITFNHGSTNAASLSWRLPGNESKDRAAIMVLAHLLSIPVTDGIKGLVKADKNGMLSEALELQMRQASIFRVGTYGFKGIDPLKQLNYIQTKIAELVKQGFSAKSVEVAKQQVLAKLKYEDNSSLAEAWSNALTIQHLDSPEQLKTEVSAVTVDQVNRVARQYLQMDKAVIILAYLPDKNGIKQNKHPLEKGKGSTDK